MQEEKSKSEKMKKEHEGVIVELHSKLESKEELSNELSKRFKLVEENNLLNSRQIQNIESNEEFQQLQKEVSEKKLRVQQLEEELSALKESNRLQTEELSAELNKVKAELGRRMNLSKVNNSVFEGDDLTLLMVENENLKKEIKMLKNDSMKQNEKDKLLKKALEKEAEIAILRDRNGELESEVVSLSGENTTTVDENQRGYRQWTDQSRRAGQVQSS